MVRCLRSPLLWAAGFRHGFGLRGSDGVDPVSLDAQERALSRLLRVEPEALYRVRQVHGAAVVDIRAVSRPEAIRPRPADALVAGPGHGAIAIATADCLPLLLADPESGAVAAVHVGWRGLVAGVVPATLARLKQGHAVPPGRLQAAIMPHIRGCCFEIGAEVAEPLSQLTANAVEHRAGSSRPFGRLAVAVRFQLQQAGVSEVAIDEVAGCTMCQPDRFYSYRRAGAGAGRHLSAIAARA